MERSRFGRFLTQKLAYSRQRKKIPRTVLRSFTHPCFPFTFFVRNVMTLALETDWKKMAPRLKRIKMRNMLEERSRFFLEVSQWLAVHGEAKLDSLEEDCKTKNVEEAPPPESSYCTHCGGCCEIAGGLPDFPSESVIPARWQCIFGEGLGRGHRFCPFLWEERTSSRSLCAIHPWRSLPCRTFEADECSFLLQDPEFKKLSDRTTLNETFRLLLRLIDAR